VLNPSFICSQKNGVNFRNGASLMLRSFLLIVRTGDRQGILMKFMVRNVSLNFY